MIILMGSNMASISAFNNFVLMLSWPALVLGFIDVIMFDISFASVGIRKKD